MQERPRDAAEQQGAERPVAARSAHEQVDIVSGVGERGDGLAFERDGLGGEAPGSAATASSTARAVVARRSARTSATP